MEALALLEGKIKSLVELISKLKEEGARLKAENYKLEEENLKLLERVSGLENRLDTFEGAAVEKNKSLNELSQEKELTRVFVDDLIKSIDSLVQDNQQ